ncbi:hypothetical protein G6F31_019050 [Rhizopus arrhizus]|nr:hypothetical protein G6F31_019050 [Rhizopus arrhizus]
MYGTADLLAFPPGPLATAAAGRRGARRASLPTAGAGRRLGQSGDLGRHADRIGACPDDGDRPLSACAIASRGSGAIAARGAATHRCLVHFAAIGRAGTGSPDRHTAKGQRPFRRGQAEREPPSQTNGA